MATITSETTEKKNQAPSTSGSTSKPLAGDQVSPLVARRRKSATVQPEAAQAVKVQVAAEPSGGPDLAAFNTVEMSLAQQEHDRSWDDEDTSRPSHGSLLPEEPAWVRAMEGEQAVTAETPSAAPQPQEPAAQVSVRSKPRARKDANNLKAVIVKPAPKTSPKKQAPETSKSKQRSKTTDKAVAAGIEATAAGRRVMQVQNIPDMAPGWSQHQSSLSVNPITISGVHINGPKAAKGVVKASKAATPADDHPKASGAVNAAIDVAAPVVPAASATSGPDVVSVDAITAAMLSVKNQPGPKNDLFTGAAAQASAVHKPPVKSATVTQVASRSVGGFVTTAHAMGSQLWGAFVRRRAEFEASEPRSAEMRAKGLYWGRLARDTSRQARRQLSSLFRKSPRIMIGTAASRINALSKQIPPPSFTQPGSTPPAFDLGEHVVLHTAAPDDSHKPGSHPEPERATASHYIQTPTGKGLFTRLWKRLQSIAKEHNVSLSTAAGPVHIPVHKVDPTSGVASSTSIKADVFRVHGPVQPVEAAGVDIQKAMEDMRLHHQAGPKSISPARSSDGISEVASTQKRMDDLRDDLHARIALDLVRPSVAVEELSGAVDPQLKEDLGRLELIRAITLPKLDLSVRENQRKVEALREESKPALETMISFAAKAGLSVVALGLLLRDCQARDRLDHVRNLPGFDQFSESIASLWRPYVDADIPQGDDLTLAHLDIQQRFLMQQDGELRVLENELELHRHTMREVVQIRDDLEALVLSSIPSLSDDAGAIMKRAADDELSRVDSAMLTFDETALSAQASSTTFRRQLNNPINAPRLVPRPVM